MTVGAHLTIRQAQASHANHCQAGVPLGVIADAARVRRHLIFDLDGTLVDSNAECVRILQQMLTERGCTRQIDKTSARPFMSRGGTHMVAGLLAENCADPAVDLAEFRARYLAGKTTFKSLFEGVYAGLRRVAAAGFTMSICSNKPQQLCEKVLRDTELAEFMVAIVGGQSVLAPKPAPDALHAVLRLANQEPGACIFVGDSDLDYRVARDANLPFAFMTYGYAPTGWQPEANNDWHAAAGQSFKTFDDLVAALHAGVSMRP